MLETESLVIDTLAYVLGQRNFFSLPYVGGSVSEYAAAFKSKLEALSYSINEPEMVAAGVWTEEELGDWRWGQPELLSDESELLDSLIWSIGSLVDALNRKNFKAVKEICDDIRSLV